MKSKLQKLSEGFSEVKCLEEFSGIGFVGAVTLSALIDIPERFSTVKKIWIYSGYGLDRQSSGNNPGRPRITKRSNRMIKDVIMTAVHIIIQVDKSSSYKLWYLEQIRLGKSPQKMRATLARKLIIEGDIISQTFVASLSRRCGVAEVRLTPRLRRASVCFILSLSIRNYLCRHV